MPKKTDFTNKKKISYGITETKVINMQDFNTDSIVEIPVELLTKAKNIRDVLTDGDQELEELGASMKEDGQLQPIVVAKDGDRYKILVGSRRFKAAIKAGIPTLRCVIADDFEDERERILKQAIENEQRKDMTPAERENYIARLTELGMNQTQIANALHKSRIWINLALKAKDFRKENEEEISKLGFEPSTRDILELQKLTDNGLKEAIKETVEAGGTKEQLHKTLAKKTKENEEKEKIPTFNEDKAEEEAPKEKNIRKVKISVSVTFSEDDMKAEVSTEGGSDKSLSDAIKEACDHYLTENGWRTDK